jgi:hypothetical protein
MDSNTPTGFNFINMLGLLNETAGQDICEGTVVADRLLNVLPCVPDAKQSEFLLKNLTRGEVLYVNTKTSIMRFSTFKPTGDIQL